jgi:hypothetical protein
LITEQRKLQERIDAEVDQLADAGSSWPAIAAVLGVTRQAARQRHLRRVSGP